MSCGLLPISEEALSVSSDKFILTVTQACIIFGVSNSQTIEGLRTRVG